MKSRSVFKQIKKMLPVIIAGLVLFFEIGALKAQGLTLDSSPASTFSAGGSYLDIALVSARFILAVILGIAGIIGLYAGYRWLTNEGNALKGHENKQIFAKAVLVITIVFVVMSIMRMYIPDYSTLSF